jgi:hypothetical protein
MVTQYDAIDIDENGALNQLSPGTWWLGRPIREMMHTQRKSMCLCTGQWECPCPCTRRGGRQGMCPFDENTS